MPFDMNDVSVERMVSRSRKTPEQIEHIRRPRKFGYQEDRAKMEETRRRLLSNARVSDETPESPIGETDPYEEFNG